ncbi:MAG TPA: ribosome assembly cofactor RimP [Bacteroidales bacterium]|nr:ribosome assembly cofactor RimP [Bacteroidales bacterium]
MITKENIENILEGILKEKNAYLVDIHVSPSNKISIEVDSMNSITIDDCVDISRWIENNFDRDQEDFELEVSSPGLSQPFKVIQQYQKNLNKEIEVITKEGKKLIGTLIVVNPDAFEMKTSKLVKIEGKKKKQLIEENIRFLYTEVKSVKVVISFK